MTTETDIVEETAARLISEIQAQLKSSEEGTLVYRGAIQGIEELLKRLSAEEPPAQSEKES